MGNAHLEGDDKRYLDAHVDELTKWAIGARPATDLVVIRGGKDEN